VADEQDVEVVTGEAAHLVMDLRHERARGVDRLEPAPGRLGVNRRRDPVRGEHNQRTLGHLVGLLDEDRAARL